MEEEKRSMCIHAHAPQLEDVPELINHIQSLLPVKEAAGTCVLSKSWLRAWSTVPTLTFPQSTLMVSEDEDIKYMKLFDSTLQRYLRNNIPIKPFDIHLDIKKHESSPLVENWIQSVVSKSFFKELHLTFFVKTDSFTLPHQIFASKILRTIILRVLGCEIDSVWVMSKPVMIMSNSVINCVSLRVLDLSYVDISDEVLDRILSTCNLLEKINLKQCEGLKTFKIKNLRYLSELTIQSTTQHNILEMVDVPSLHLFVYGSSFQKPLPFSVDLPRSLTELHLNSMIIDNAFFDMINLKLPLLVTLNLHTSVWGGTERLNITSASLKSLILELLENKQPEIQVYAPKLLDFLFRGITMPSLLFPTTNAPKRIDFELYLWDSIDHSFLDRISKTLNCSSKFNIDIMYIDRDLIVPINVDVDDLKISVPFPSTNVQQLSFTTSSDDCGGKHGLLFDAFFSICHPKYLTVYHSKCKHNRLCKIMDSMVSEMMEKKMPSLKDVKMINPHNGQWETLTNSSRSFLINRSTYGRIIRFKLDWCSE